MTQDELKQAVAQAAADHVAQTAPAGSIIGVGTGSTANFFIDGLAGMKALGGCRMAVMLSLLPVSGKSCHPFSSPTSTPP